MEAKRILYNPKVFVSEDIKGRKVESEGKDIVNYRIEEAEFDRDGEIIIDPNTNMPKWTGKTLEWTIKAGETVEFPAYVADYLRKIYSFLEEKKATEVKVEVAESKVGGSGKLVCPKCGKVFVAKKGFALHMAMKHTDEIVGGVLSTENAKEPRD